MNTVALEAKLLKSLNRLENLSLRERLLLLLGLPMALAALAEVAVFAPAQRLAVTARKDTERQTAELAELRTILGKLPETSGLPAADQLLAQRNVLKARIDEAETVKATLGETTDWGSVVRAAVTGAPGLVLTQMRTVPAEVVFTPAMARAAAATPAKPGGAPAAAASAVVPSAPVDPRFEITVYRHRADLALQGNFEPLLGYMQGLQRAPGNLRWDRLQLSVANYPQATMQLNLYTLSTRAETPFN